MDNGDGHVNFDFNLILLIQLSNLDCLLQAVYFFKDQSQIETGKECQKAVPHIQINIKDIAFS